jgi:hypothetical protein
MKKLLLVAILTMMASGAQALTVNQLNEFNRATRETYMMGLADGARGMGELCSGQATYNQRIAILDKYIANNPEEWEESIGYIYIKAMVKAFKCGDDYADDTVKPLPKTKTEVRW